MDEARFVSAACLQLQEPDGSPWQVGGDRMLGASHLAAALDQVCARPGVPEVKGSSVEEFLKGLYNHFLLLKKLSITISSLLSYSWKKGVDNGSPLFFIWRHLPFLSVIRGSVLAFVRRWLCLFWAFLKARGSWERARRLGGVCLPGSATFALAGGQRARHVAVFGL